jgi:uncharacterized RDD family membrane protein YckC
MKCPKCGYLGFERVDRCRNCQYDFSLASPTPEPDFTIRREPESSSALEELSLVDAASPWGSAPLPLGEDGDLDRIFGAPESKPAPASPMPGAPARVERLPRIEPSQELPLFGPPIPDDEPLITRASPPRTPLAVRRGTPDVPRLRADPPVRASNFDLALDLDVDDADPSMMPIVLPADRTTMKVWTDKEQVQAAGLAVRFLAVLIDVVILTIVDVLVVYFTMQLCDLTADELWILPKGPLVAFLLLQNGGYLVAFTAGGQTLGKMAAGIRVVQSDSDAPLDFGRAFLRTLMWAVLALPVGLGFLTALFSRDHRGLHDRFAGTRVVRASA